MADTSQHPTVVIMGLGYIGLPTAGLIASKGIRVHGVDVNADAVDIINQGKIHIVEPDLEGLVHYAVTRHFLSAHTEPAPADVFVIAVPTPFVKETYQADLTYVESATRMIAPHVAPGNTVILESTSPVGTTEKMAEWIYAARPELRGQLHVAYCPERVLPGRVIYELVYNERAIGGLNAEATEKAAAFYALFVKGTLHKTNARTAEMCKLVENSYRDANIAFANELSMICEKAGIDVWELITLANKHPRVNILQPGPGVGGHCIAVDPWFIVHDFPDDARLIRTSREVNVRKNAWVSEKVAGEAAQFERTTKRKPVIACMGLAFKANIDDLRESPALEVTEHLLATEHSVLAVEPNITRHAHLELTDYREAAAQADIIVFLVAHNEFKKLNVSGKIVVDVCGVTR